MMTITGNKAQDLRNARIVLEQTPQRIQSLIKNSNPVEQDLYDRCIRNLSRELFTAARVSSRKLSWYAPVIGI